MLHLRRAPSPLALEQAFLEQPPFDPSSFLFLVAMPFAQPHPNIHTQRQTMKHQPPEEAVCRK